MIYFNNAGRQDAENNENDNREQPDHSPNGNGWYSDLNDWIKNIPYDPCSGIAGCHPVIKIPLTPEEQKLEKAAAATLEKRKRTKKIIYTTAAVAAVIGVSIFIYKKVKK